MWQRFKPNMRSHRSDWRREMKFQCISKVIQRSVFCLSLARDVNLYTLSHEPFIFLPDAGGEILFDITNAPSHESSIE